MLTLFTSMKTRVDIAIIGAGFAGIGMAIQLKKAGITGFLILERESDVGGVWRDNTYPGCACDVESPLYSFSFLPNPKWSRMYSGQKEIWDYLRECTDKFDLWGACRFNHELKSARWNSELQLWELHTSKGLYTARALVSGTGAFSQIKFPDIPGIEDFKGTKFHSANWNHDYDLKGKRVGVIGTGASAIQFVPEIQPLVSKLELFQRTPPWILPRLDRPFTEREKFLFKRFPVLQAYGRYRIYRFREQYGLAFRDPKHIGMGTSIAERHMKKAIKDPVLLEKLRPKYTMGCKRILLSNNYYPALAQPNVEVITDEISRITAQGVELKNGDFREVDAIIFGTGFQTTEFRIADLIFGREGKSLTSVWRGSPQAHLGTTVAEFPNLFMLLGPNTGLAHTSVVLMIEAQIEHAVKAIKFMRKNSIVRYNHRPWEAVVQRIR